MANFTAHEAMEFAMVKLSVFLPVRQGLLVADCFELVEGVQVYLLACSWVYADVWFCVHKLELFSTCTLTGFMLVVFTLGVEFHLSFENFINVHVRPEPC